MPEQLEGVTIHYARRIEDVLAVALPEALKPRVREELVQQQQELQQEAPAWPPPRPDRRGNDSGKSAPLL